MARERPESHRKGAPRLGGQKAGQMQSGPRQVAAGTGPTVMNTKRKDSR